MTDFHYELLLLLGLILVASVMGVLALYSFTIMPALKKLSDAEFVKAFAAIDSQIVKSVFMVQFFAPVFVLCAAVVYAFSQQVDGVALVSGAFACYLGVVAVTIGVNVPLNDGIKRARSADAAKVRTQFNEQKWTTFNHVRLALGVIAVGLLAAAFVI
jgi:uncharacterized membrane protein